MTACLIAGTLSLVGCSREPTRPERPHATERHRQKPHASPTPRPSRSFSLRAPARIAIVVMENKEYEEVIGSNEAPFTNRLASSNTLLTQEYAIGHPSLPNYLALIGGSTFGVHSDCTDCYQDAETLVDQLEAAGISWKAYMEDMPEPCFEGPSSGDYAQKHNPFAYFDAIRNDPRRCRKVVPMSQLAGDLSSHDLPRFSFITPDLCHDTHDCPVATGDEFLSKLVPDLIGELGRGGFLILTYDEGDSTHGCCGLARGGRVATIIAGPGARRGARISTPLSHYSLLRLVEDSFGLPRLGAAGDERTPTVEGYSSSG
jgi:phosphatidylinositol-3-phosphatase